MLLNLLQYTKPPLTPQPPKNSLAPNVNSIRLRNPDQHHLTHLIDFLHLDFKLSHFPDFPPLSLGTLQYLLLVPPLLPNFLILERPKAWCCTSFFFNYTCFLGCLLSSHGFKCHLCAANFQNSTSINTFFWLLYLFLYRFPYNCLLIPLLDI